MAQKKQKKLPHDLTEKKKKSLENQVKPDS